MKITIRQLTLTEEVPLSILMLADPKERLIRQYLTRGSCFVAEHEAVIVGAIVFLDTRPETIEIVNVAVAEQWQQKGIGTQLIKYVLEQASAERVKTVEIGTGNSSIQQLALYQKLGFRMIGIDHDFFVRHYDEEIIENGIRCVDMVRLSLHL